MQNNNFELLNMNNYKEDILINTMNINNNTIFVKDLLNIDMMVSLIEILI